MWTSAVYIKNNKDFVEFELKMNHRHTINIIGSRFFPSEPTIGFRFINREKLSLETKLKTKTNCTYTYVVICESGVQRTQVKVQSLINDCTFFRIFRVQTVIFAVLVL